jgi:hypothetical protein
MMNKRLFDNNWAVWTEHQRSRHGFVQIEIAESRSDYALTMATGYIDPLEDEGLWSEKRKNRRRSGYRVRAWINIKRFWIYQESLRVILKDYSRNGARLVVTGGIRGKLSLNKGKRFVLRLAFHHDAFYLNCQIVHCHKEQQATHIGVRFINPSRAIQVRLKKLTDRHAKKPRNR